VAKTYRTVPAQDSQLAAIPGIEHAAATMFSEQDLPRQVRYRVTDMETLREAQRPSRLWLAVNEIDVPVGFAYASEIDGHAHLEEMGVHPDHGRRGIGKSLVATVREWAESRGHTDLTLVTFGHLAWNAPFYRALGFVQIPQDRLSDSMTALLDEEQAAGIDVQNRMVMQLSL
jgi:GNAT superfamily N-acetyltransferase